eukprot:CAMPEP_0198506984 /NCGR_PEP_ID=MMETSP1462-20131121/12029_1 /TAXON_ID=1333877 /ORGANISM="Brandtodinium nutriculum, Strain RCC3387" /LENGTH=64 /DNA_ID=CAMNT_0044236217 /DNA_START=411 /DNA_END=605 /DNA_ORIENTATION=-
MSSSNFDWAACQGINSHDQNTYARTTVQPQTMDETMMKLSRMPTKVKMEVQTKAMVVLDKRLAR